MDNKNKKKSNGKRRYRDRNRGATHYITCNINRFKSELTENEIKEMLLSVISKAKAKFVFEMLDFVILNDHFHFIIKPDENEDEYYLSKIMKWILSVSAINFNKLTGQKGKVWYDRFKSEIIEVGRKIREKSKKLKEFVKRLYDNLDRFDIKDVFNYKFSGLYKLSLFRKIIS